MNSGAWFAGMMSVAWPLAVAAAPQTYLIDPGHTYPSFEAPHMGLSWWRGKFTRTSGRIVLDREAGTGTVEVTVEIPSVDFGHQAMNEVILGEQWFNAARYPVATYRGDAIRFENGIPVAVDGALTMLGVTRPLSLSIAAFRCRMNPMLGREVCGADARASFKRTDFGMDRNAQQHGEEVRLQIQVEAVRELAP
jgi:polyisoprenoid-binding protein YceI